MIPELENYYLTNYSKCNLSDNYLSTREGLAYPSHIIQVIAAPIQIFTFFIILKKTPKTMKTIKWPLLINHFCSTWFDFEVCTLSTPYIFLPTTSFFSVGILSCLGLSYILQMIIGGLSAVSFASSYIYLFESRSNSIKENRFRMTRKYSRICYHNFVFSINLSVIFFLYFTTTEESQKLEALKIDPCPTKEFFQFSLVFCISNPTIRKFFLFFCAPALLSHMPVNALFHILCTVYYLFLAPPSRSISPETSRAQRHFFIGIIFQTSIPILTLFIPIFVLLVLVLTDSYRQSLMNLAIIIFGLNGFIESLAILSVYRPYRNAVKDILNFRKSKEPKIQTTPVRGVCASYGIGRTDL